MGFNYERVRRVYTRALPRSKGLTYSNDQSMSCPTDAPVNAIVNVILLFQGEE